MTQTRTFLLIAWLLVGFLLWEAWQTDYHRAPAVADVERSAELSLADAAVPQPTPDLESGPSLTPSAELTATVAAPSAQAAGGTPVVVETDRLRLTFDTRGATLVSAELLDYQQSAEDGAPPVQLLTREADRFFIAQSSWVAAAGLPVPNHEQVFAVEASEYVLAPGEDRLALRFTWSDASGLRLTKTFGVERGSYVVTLEETLENAGEAPWRGRAYRQLLRQPPANAGYSFTNPESYSYVGAAWFTPGEKFNKLAFDDFDARNPLDVNGRGGWVAMLQHYFFAAWIPDPAEDARFASATTRDGRYLIRSDAPTIELAPGASHQSAARLYIGPKLQEELAAVAPGLERTIDYGIFTVLSEPLFWLLSLFHGLTGNWGWAIILLVLLIKAVFFKLSEAQYKSFAKMRAVQPRIESLKERYGDDKQKFNMAMMELYKKEKINPMGGCLPILVQIPVFISLYWVLLESVELRHAPWMGWIQNLSAPDPYFILPVLNLATMWATQKLSPAPGMDPLQKKMMQAMPLVFGVMFAFFPAGLVLYWTVNGALGLLQQWVITKMHGGPAKA